MEQAIGFLSSVGSWITGVLSSLALVYLTQLIKSRVFEPKAQMKSLVSEAHMLLDFYEDLVKNPGKSTAEKYAEASSAYRDLARRMMCFARQNPATKANRLKAENLDKAAMHLIGLSNSVVEKDEKLASLGYVRKIEKELNIER